MIKNIFLLAVIAVFSANLRAQSIMQSFGATISGLSGKINTQYSSSGFSMTQTNLTYFPRYNFIENDNSSVSIGAPVGIGIGLATNTFGSDVGVAFAYDLPLVLDYNIGCKSTMENENTFGGYFGVGFGYYKVNISGSSYSDFKGTSYGPMLRGGVRIGSDKESWSGHGITIGIFYKEGLEADKLKTFGFNVLYDL